MAKEVVRSGVTFDRKSYDKLNSIVKESKRFKIDKSEIINTIINNSKFSLKQMQDLVMNYREKKKADVVRSGVTFDNEIYVELSSTVKDSIRFKIDKSEIINALVDDMKDSLKIIQNKIMDYRER